MDLIHLRFHILRLLYKLLALLLKHGMIILGKNRESFQLLLPGRIT